MEAETTGALGEMHTTGSGREEQGAWSDGEMEDLESVVKNHGIPVLGDDYGGEGQWPYKSFGREVTRFGILKRLTVFSSQGTTAQREYVEVCVCVGVFYLLFISLFIYLHWI